MGGDRAGSILVVVVRSSFRVSDLDVEWGCCRSCRSELSDLRYAVVIVNHSLGESERKD